MVYEFLFPLRDLWFGFNVFKYITFRAVFAAVTAMGISIFLGPWMIRFLYQLKVGQEIRKEECPPLYSLHQKKEGTPTMGGALILIAIGLSVLLWGRWDAPQVWLVLFVTMVLGGLGFVDDFIKITKKQSKGLSAKAKLAVQSVVSLLLAFYLLRDERFSSVIRELYIPFLKAPIVDDLGLLFVLLTFLVLVGSSNAVNLTDGLDGLAIGCVIIACFAFSILAYAVGHVEFSQYLGLRYIPQSGELTVFCAALIGAGLGFLWYNAPPAQVFMGDTGSLALGGAIGTIALLIKKEWILVLVGGIFVFEALSVIIQVISFRVWGKRVFAIAPLHHHFEMKGWSETKVTIRFWILAIVFALLGLGSIKLM